MSQELLLLDLVDHPGRGWLGLVGSGDERRQGCVQTIRVVGGVAGQGGRGDVVDVVRVARDLGEGVKIVLFLHFGIIFNVLNLVNPEKEAYLYDNTARGQNLMKLSVLLLTFQLSDIT